MDPDLLNEWQQMLNNMTEDINQPTKMKDKLKRNIAEHIHKGSFIRHKK